MKKLLVILVCCFVSMNALGYVDRICVPDQHCYDDADCANNPYGGSKGHCDIIGDECAEYLGGISYGGLCSYEADDIGGGGGSNVGNCSGTDSDGCAYDSNLSNSCAGAPKYSSGIYQSVACVNRANVNSSLPTGYAIYNGSWASTNPGYAKFCYCAASECDGIVTVKPCLLCSSGYHEENNKCVKDKTCSDCNSTDWTAYSTGYERKTTATCNTSTGVCNKTYTYRCAVGYYGSSTNGTSGCTKCNTINGIQSTTSSAGQTSCTACCVDSGATGTNTKGAFKLTAKCCNTSC